MDSKKKTAILFVSLALVIIAAVVLYPLLAKKTAPDPDSKNGEKTENSKEDASVSDDPAPDFSVYDKNGKQVMLSDFYGKKPVVVNFWATWCGYCVEEMPQFEEAYKKYGDEVEFMMVDLTDNQRETMTGAKEFIKNSGFTFPVFFDTMFEASDAYTIYNIPRTIVINRDGSLARDIVGALQNGTLEAILKDLVEN